MKKLLIAIFTVLLFLMSFYLIIEIFRILFDSSKQSFTDILLQLIIVLIGLYFVGGSKIKSEQPAKVSETINSSKEKIVEKNNSKYIITASSKVCGILSENLKNNEFVISTFEDSGFWYTNGETGPEWFTVTIKAKWEHKKQIEELVKAELQKINVGASNFYWS